MRENQSDAISSYHKKKIRSQLTTNRVTPTSPQATPAGVLGTVEKVLPNGDLYTGSFSCNAPHGSGKYLWKDGCMYEGEWRRGKACGKGKFSWPSGATFEGEFKSGRMEGFGTFIGSDGDSYRGSWSTDRKNGYGQKQYINGDFYEGMWKKNVQDGHGRYVWRNGHEYVGEWRNGAISGKGILVWADGDRSERQCENGVPKGKGADADLLMTATMGKRSSVEGGRGSNISFPRICIWEQEGDAGDITCDIIDNLDASMIYGERLPFMNSSCCFHCGGGEVKKQGQTISKGHKNYDLMLNLQLGIRYSVGKHAHIVRDPKRSDFNPSERFWTRFPPEGSKMTPPHQSAEFRWKDYCPVVFRHLRERFLVDPADYMLAICGNDALRELSSPGKSGSFFYLTQDDRFMIKTVRKSEVKVLVGMLQSYYQHVCRYENSLVTKFFGVHCIKPITGPKTRFIVMGNLFCSEYRIHKRFDLKGSSYGRATDKQDGEIDETTTFKDLDLNYVFSLQSYWFQELMQQINRDCEFLEAERIMDYSLLVGLHFRGDNTCEKMGFSPFVLCAEDSQQNEKFMCGCCFFEAIELQDVDRLLAGGKPLIRLGANMPARAERVGMRSNLERNRADGADQPVPPDWSETCEVIMYFGIIDILQNYDIAKKLEHVYKSLQADPSSISAVDPKLYSKRFRDFVRRIFVEGT